MRARAQRIASLAVAPLVSLIVFRRVFSTWFLKDDFGWMGLRDIAHDYGIFYALLHPYAQGTVRVLSERVPFLLFPAIFGMNPLPFRVAAWITWIAALVLAALIGERLTGSRAAGLIAAIFWGVNANLTRPLGWASDYNEVLCALCILTAFYARLRGWRAMEWIAFLVGFGVLEVAAVYPAIALLYELSCGARTRERVRSSLYLFVPSAIFALVHAIYIPKLGASYQIAIDFQIARTMIEYLKLAAGPADLYAFTGTGQAFGKIATAALFGALLLFVLWRTFRRDFLALFCCAWFVLLLAPMLVLPKHVMDYALTTPMAGLAWLGGWAVVMAWRAGWMTRVAAVTMAALYLGSTIYEAELYTAWYRDRTLRIKAVVQGVETAHRAHPDCAFILQGIDADIFNSGFEDDPFSLIHATIYLAPGTEQFIPMQGEMADRSRWVLSPRGAFAMLEQGRARSLSLTGTTMRDTTSVYRAVLKLNPEVSRQDFVDAGDPVFAAQLGSGWFQAENHLRWMGREGVVKMSGPVSASQKLILTGFAPAALLAAGPVVLRFSADGSKIGEGSVHSADDRFTFEFALPAALVGKSEIEVKIEASRTLRPPGDNRDLGMAFGTFAIR